MVCLYIFINIVWKAIFAVAQPTYFKGVASIMVNIIVFRTFSW